MNPATTPRTDAGGGRRACWNNGRRRRSGTDDRSAPLGGELLATAQDLEPSEIDVTELGPQVGELVPEFSLPDQYGEIQTRESIMGPNGAMLVFIRSADW